MKLTFRSSTRCNPWDCPKCVEVANLPDGGKAIRDSKTGGVLTFDAQEWAAFAAGFHAGEFE